MTELMTALGLMSGTSMDGIDVAVIRTDGEGVIKRGPGATYPYSAEQRRAIKLAAEKARANGGGGDPETEEMLTRAHAEAIAAFRAAHEGAIDVIGFHGQTVLHAPERKITRQLGDGAMLARMTGADVVFDFRRADVEAGGQGAPFVPVYHRALVEAAGMERPVAVLNLGGVSNVTYVGDGDTLLAFDIGPANALIDDFVLARTGARYDEGGALAALGRVDEDALAALMDNPYFAAPPPKSLDRDDFEVKLGHLSDADGAATLTEFTAAAIEAALPLLPERPRLWIASGGGARNPFMLERIAARLGARLSTADELGWSADFMEAEAFAFLAARSLRGLPLTYPSTTGAPRPMTGGRLARA